MMFVAGLCYGENMEFVTVLSSPVGTFASLETADATKVTQAQKVNFGSRLSSGGTIEMTGTTGPSLGALKLDDNAGLSSTNAKEVRLSGMTVNRSGAVTGNSLLADTMNVRDASQSYLKVTGTSAGQMQIDSGITVQGAGADKLTINRTGNKKDQFNNATNANSMVWSNVHLTDPDGTVKAIYSRQYLLKGKPVRTFVPHRYVDVTQLHNIEPLSRDIREGQCAVAQVTVPGIGDFSSGLPPVCH